VSWYWNGDDCSSTGVAFSYVTDWQNVKGCGRCGSRCAGKDGESHVRSICLSESVGELAAEDGALDASDRKDSSLILVCSGSSTLKGRSAHCSSDSRTWLRAKDLVAIDPVDLEKGDSSIGVTLMRDEGESNDCARMRTLGDGVRGGAIMVAMLMRQ
jgi:hypothetical protein